MTSDAQGPYSPAETCTSCSHQSFWHGSGAPRCSFMVQGKILCGCTNLRFQGRAQQPDDALRVAALEAALSDLVQAIEGEHRDGVPVTRSIRLNAMFRAAKAALDGAPYEPSEEMVERAAEALYEVQCGEPRDPEYADIDVWLPLARAALRAAFNSGESPSGTDQRPTDQR